LPLCEARFPFVTFSRLSNLVAVNRRQQCFVRLSDMAPNAPNLIALLTMAPTAFSSGELGPLPRIKSVAALRKEVLKHFGKLPSQDIDALVVWFNRNFFRLED
jgi:hypothetical protein